MNERAIPDGGDRRPARRLRSGGVGLGVGQRRLRQDPRAGAARDPPAARRHQPDQDPVPDLHQGGRRQHGEPHLRDARANGSTLDDADARRGDPRRPARRGIDARQRAQARRLFASALETPGGLKVQTIHGFCTRLLQQFPFEANVAARFRVLEETAAEPDAGGHPPRGAARSRAAAGQSPPAARSRRSSRLASDFAFQDCAGRGDPRARRDHGMARPRRRRSRPRGAQLSAALGIEPGDTIEAVESEIVDGPHLPSARVGVAPRRSARAGSSERPEAGRAPVPHAAAATGVERVEAYLSVFFTGQRTSRARRVITAALVKKRARLSRGAWPTSRAASHALCEKRRAVAGARPHAGAARRSRAEVIERYAAEKDRARPARLRRPDRQDARRCSTASSGLGALQARPRHRPRADRRGAGHEPASNGTSSSASSPSSPPAPARAAAEALDLRGRRRQAVDLLVPGRGAGGVRRDAPRSSRRAHARRRAAVPADPVQVFVPLGAGRAGRGRRGVQAAGRPRRPDRRSGADRARGGARRPRPAWSNSGRWSSPTRSRRSMPGTRRSTRDRKPARASSWRGRSPAR